MSTSSPPLRRDAAENRARILRESTRVFATRGADVDVREIARAANVGMGTLYRHFPTKEALLAAIAQRNVQEWVDAARDAPRVDPWSDLRRFLEDSLRRHERRRAVMGSAGASLLSAEAVRDNRRMVRPVIDDLIESAQRAGVVRTDVTSVDVHLLLLALCRIVPLGEDVWQRQLDLVLDGFRTPDPTPLSSPPMRPGAFDDACLDPMK